MPVAMLREFLRLESASGIVLMMAALLALLMVNSPLAPMYDHLLATPVEVRVGALLVAKPLLLWINDGLMAIFFLLVGLEIKREILDGHLSTAAQASLPGIAAIGGMAAPAAVYVVINIGSRETLGGWAIPAATDIAFALGILSLLGNRVPIALKTFLLALAIIDDLGAIIIIALFYTADLALESLLLAGICLVGLFAMNRLGVMRLGGYILLGVVLWVCVLKSGVHATLAGVALAFALPSRPAADGGEAPAVHVEHTLLPWVAFGIMPVFAFANAGVSFAGISVSDFVDPVPLGIAAGLFIGKQVGVLGLTWAAIRLRLSQLPEGVRWSQFYGVAVLTGVGFTMSLFIGTLAFPDPAMAAEVRLGVLAGSALSAVVGYVVLRVATERQPAPARAGI